MLRHAIYPGAVLLWMTYVLIFPSWVGKLYHPDAVQPKQMISGGSFGLADESVKRPLWDPPKPYGDLGPVSIRYPWQPVTLNGHIELDTLRLVQEFTLGVAALGLLIVGWQMLTSQLRTELVTIPTKRAMVMAGYLGGTMLFGFGIATFFGSKSTLWVSILVLELLFAIVMVAGLPSWMTWTVWGATFTLALTWIVLLVLIVLSAGYIRELNWLFTIVPLGSMVLGGILGVAMQQWHTGSTRLQP
jgi:hypothetical protein